MEPSTIAAPAAQTGGPTGHRGMAPGSASRPVPLPTDHECAGHGFAGRGFTGHAGDAGPPGVAHTADPWRSVEETTLLESVRPLFSDAGITRVADLTGLDDLGVACVSAIRPNAASLAVSAGKGTTLAAATASAVMEALETAAAERFRPPLRLATQAELNLRGVACVALDALARTPFARTPTTPILWCDGQELGTGRPRAVPFELTHADWSLTGGYARASFPRDSNGLASGATAAEARLHALFELVERDAARVYEHASHGWRARRRVRLDPAVTPLAHGLAQRIGAGRLVGVWDLTGDIGVPVVMCVVCEATPDPFRPLPAAAGLGCHLDVDRAATRALTEAAQSRLITIAGARDDQTREAYARCFDPTGTERFRRELADADADLRPLGADSPGTGGHPPRCGRAALMGAQAAATPDDGDAEAVAEHWSDALAARITERTGHRPVAVDLTPAGWPIAVTRVVAPGLEGAGAMFGAASLPGERASAGAAGSAADGRDDAPGAAGNAEQDGAGPEGGAGREGGGTDGSRQEGTA